jgi:hypothetical protein
MTRLELGVLNGVVRPSLRHLAVSLPHNGLPLHVEEYERSIKLAFDLGKNLTGWFEFTKGSIDLVLVQKVQRQ